MFTVPPSKGIIARRFCLYEITNGEEKTFHSYSIICGEGWRFSTAIQNFNLVIDTWYWSTKSGSEYSCNNYFTPIVDEWFLDDLKKYFNGDKIRRVCSGEISGIFD